MMINSVSKKNHTLDNNCTIDSVYLHSLLTFNSKKSKIYSGAHIILCRLFLYKGN